MKFYLPKLSPMFNLSTPLSTIFQLCYCGYYHVTHIYLSTNAYLYHVTIPTTCCKNFSQIYMCSQLWKLAVEARWRMYNINIYKKHICMCRTCKKKTICSRNYIIAKNTLVHKDEIKAVRLWQWCFNYSSRIGLCSISKVVTKSWGQ